ncbi:MAG: helix-turn-helix domain-containing protein, partial [Anaeromyxobacteraceae bacterium]
LLSRAGARAGRALRLSPEAIRVVLSHDWPGNVRELENALEFAATVCRGQTVQPEDFPPEITGAVPLAEEPEPGARRAAPVAGPGALRGGARPSASAPECEALTRALDAHRWSRAETALALGVSRSTLWRRMRAAGLE